MPPGATPIIQHIASTAMPAGMRRTFTEFGTPLETLDVPNSTKLISGSSVQLTAKQKGEDSKGG
jgi:hypothetical protein